MTMISFCDLKSKEVINICDGKLLGAVCDLEIDIFTGRIGAIVLPGSGIFSSLSQKNRILIPWCDIEKIGKDTILVKHPLLTEHKKDD